MQGFIDYVELAAPDLSVSKAFYAAAFGWTFNDYGDGYAGIRSADGGTEVGGLNAGSTGGAGGVLALIRSDDAAAHVHAVVTAGGSIVEPLEPYPGGQRFVFDDVAGNRLGVYQPDE